MKFAILIDSRYYVESITLSKSGRSVERLALTRNRAKAMKLTHDDSNYTSKEMVRIERAIHGFLGWGTFVQFPQLRK
jgi:hypothetical protein